MSLKRALLAVDFVDRVHLDQPLALIRLDFDTVLTQLLDDRLKAARQDVRVRPSDTERRLESAEMDDRVILLLIGWASPPVLADRLDETFDYYRLRIRCR